MALRAASQLLLLGALGGVAGAAAAAAASGGGGACNTSSAVNATNDGGPDIASFPLADAPACLARCCAEPRCAAYTFTTFQPHASAACAQGARCCWLKSAPGARTPRANCTSGWPGSAPPAVATPSLTRVATIAADASGHLRDPSAPLRDVDGVWHFWVDYIPLSQGTEAGWHAVLHHYSARAIEGPWAAHGADVLAWSADAAAWDSGGMLSPGAMYSAEEALWYIFYTGVSAANYSATLTSAQLVASAPSPYGPWTRRGLVCVPTGAPPTWTQAWNARRCDSGRALVVRGSKGYFTKGVAGASFAQEGVYFPANASSWLPPYSAWAGNPIYNASDNPASAVDGYENCEFFNGPPGEAGGPWLHVLCQNHGGGQPHFVTRDNLSWQYVGVVDTAPALEPTPAYDGGPPGDGANVTHFISRAEGGNLHIDLFSLSWM